MNKILIALVLAVVMSVNAYSAIIVYKDIKDEFTDEREVLIFTRNDKDNASMGVSCIPGNKLLFSIFPDYYYETKKMVNLKIRFDDKPMYEKNLRRINNGVLSQDLDFILEFLNQLKNSKKMILKIEGESILRFTEYSNQDANIKNLLKGSLDIGCHKNE